MFTLFVSPDCGMSYHLEREAKTLDELRPRMAELDEAMLRWYLEKDGESYWEEVCAIHEGILQSISAMSAMSAMSATQHRQGEIVAEPLEKG